jgi:hypothetical protein
MPDKSVLFPTLGLIFCFTLAAQDPPGSILLGDPPIPVPRTPRTGPPGGLAPGLGTSGEGRLCDGSGGGCLREGL